MGVVSIKQERSVSQLLQKMPAPHAAPFDGTILLPEGQIIDFPAAERFRVLCAKITRANEGSKRYRVISVLSSLPKEGKSVTAVNLARAFSADPLCKTLLIDTNIRKPSVHRFFNLSERPGLTNVLTGKRAFEECVVSVSPTLDVLPAGNFLGDPAELVRRPAFADLLNIARLEYRYTVVDTPPVQLCAEPITISSLVDTSLLVVRGPRRKELAQDTIKSIQAERIFGIVMNEVRELSSKYLKGSGYYRSFPH